MLRQCEHTDIVSEVSGSLFLHHLGLIKRFITCEKKRKMERTGILRLRMRLGMFLIALECNR